ncbi:pyridoxamine 5'-phosphate oxidase family protein [Mycobacterium shinjukuense]|uniref:Uncharacterized protein n=1 Tax=Mycobacterium shinjukuense TaxID=398694 RepID=A0A7I7MTF9_9MYCO|nr:hypothetical protein [Mycobacterium shinjukuense]MCV6985126.1 pyridoxamine 5'-phosphate oxidase family protein [Mycobacterium shinjukuense]ORB70737.1 hypothetical protein BST45_04900 [Mycobacterium shinjukuense]BBX75092.1 hypothetical protein MSHI_29980 [Mycobacterium shinjukuense]
MTGKGAKTGKRVDLKRLAAAVTDYPFAYLITVDDAYRVHTVTVRPVLRDLPAGPDGPRAMLDVGLIGGRTRQNLADRIEVTLLWPPPEPGGYSLIVDGRAQAEPDADDETARCAVVPTRALLHREADPDSPAAARGCLHDCVVFSEPAGPA